jgi:hypothetical protein
MTAGKRPLPRPWLWLATLVAAALALALGGVGPAAADEATPRTYEGTTYSADYPVPPTQAGNQSKLWFHADAWWALLVDPSGRTVRVHELMPDHTWRPTSAVVNSDVGDVGDALQDGDTVHVLTRSSDASLSYVRLSFDAAAREYQVAPPVLITTRGSNAEATIAEDAAGALWVGYATATNVVVTPSDDGGRTWGRSVLLASDPNGQVPETASLVAYDDRVGILWSDQATGSFEFASHRAGDDPTVWAREVARSGPGEAGNHISLVTVPGEPSDTLVAAVRTSHGTPGEPADAAAAQLEALIRVPGGQWSAVPISTVAEGLEAPVLQVDEATRTLHVFASRDGAIVTKAAPLDAISFEPGTGDVFVNGTGAKLSDPTVSKDPADARSGLVVLASDPASQAYRHAEMALSPSTPAVDPQDRTPPTPPTSVQARAVSPQSVVLSWDPANDGNRWSAAGTGVPVAGYIVSRNGVEVATVTATGFEDRARAAPDAIHATSIEYSVTAVDAAGNRSAAVTLVVELPGSGTSRTTVLVAIGLLVLAGLLTAGYLLYRHRVSRGARMPRSTEPSRDEPRARTPVP